MSAAESSSSRRAQARSARIRSPMVAFSLSTTKTDSLNGAAAMQALW